MKYIDVRFSFNEIDDGEWVHLDYSSVELLNSNIPKEGRESVAEAWAQSDKYWTEITGDVIEAVAE